MAYDTIKLRSPGLPQSIIDHIERQCIMRSGQDLASGEILYELFAGELLGSWDARISVIPKYEEYVLNKNGRPVLQRCEPYLLIEGSVHKMFHGHNVYGGPTDFLLACRDFVALVEKLLETELPHADVWTVHRVDVALVYRLSKFACKEFFDGIQLISFPRRKKGAAKYAMAVYFAGKTTTVKFYHKGSEFNVHDRSRLRGFFTNLFDHLYGVDDVDNRDRVERKLKALQRLADNRLRVEVEIHSDKLQYDFDCNPKVSEVTDAYLQGVYDNEVEKLLREGKQGMDTVRDSRAVLTRLRNHYGETKGLRLYGFWNTLCTLGDDKAKEVCPESSFYRNRKFLEDAGVSWRNTDVVVVSNDSLLPADFSPVRSDKRLCYLPARIREEFQVSRDVLRLAA
jgi:II/X family phage/plasmid replication protein